MNRYILFGSKRSKNVLMSSAKGRADIARVCKEKLFRSSSGLAVDPSQKNRSRCIGIFKCEGSHGPLCTHLSSRPPSPSLYTESSRAVTSVSHKGTSAGRPNRCTKKMFVKPDVEYVD